MNMRIATCLLLLICFISALPSYAQDDGIPGGVLAARIATARRAGIAFRPLTLFSPATGPRHPDVLGHETLLRPVAAQIAALYKAKSTAISLTLIADDGKRYTLQLLPSRPLAANASIGIIDAGGRHKAAAQDEGLHYQGSVNGAPNSLAAMSVFANGEIMILFSTSEGNFVVGKVKDGSGNYIFYNDKSLRTPLPMSCGTREVDIPRPPQTAAKGMQALDCHKVQLYFECTYDLYQHHGSITATRNFLAGFFNQIQALYANDHIAIELKTLYIWTVPDDYGNTGTYAGFAKFAGFWYDLGGSYDADIAHLMGYVNGSGSSTAGGYANIDVLGAKRSGCSSTIINATYQALPVYSRDLQIVAHELGHNLGSQHTHWCGWNTGPNGTCGAIDDCFTLEPGGGCTTCGAQYQNAQPLNTWQGTIMSYCYAYARGVNLSNGFGPLPASRIRSRINACTSLKSIVQADLMPTDICNGDGAVNLRFSPGNFGAAPFTYTWTNGAQTQNLQNLSQAGTYGVTIQDSNGCVATFTTTVAARPNPGNGIPVTAPMPICCSASRQTLRLRATAPAGIDACQSVYWLRSAMPLTNAAAAKAYFETTQPANILPGNGEPLALGATLDIQPPACTAPVTVYYTPVVVTLPLPTDTLMTTATATQPLYAAISAGGPQIGGFINLPDQTAAAGNCYMADTPAVSLVVTVSGYTGRAGQLRLLVQRMATDTVVYQLFGAPGDGTYAIPAEVLGNQPLQGLRISASDYNCVSASGGLSCTASQVALAAVRRVAYARYPLRIADACSPGTSVRIDFAPAGCTGLGVPGALPAADAALYPNPASHKATLRYYHPGAQPVQLRVTDAAGSLVREQLLVARDGYQEEVIDVQAWAKGVYFVHLTCPGVATHILKLVVR